MFTHKPGHALICTSPYSLLKQPLLLLQGQVLIKGKARKGLLADDKELANQLKVGMVFQNGALFDSLNVQENVGFMLYEHSNLPDDRIEVQSATQPAICSSINSRNWVVFSLSKLQVCLYLQDLSILRCANFCHCVHAGAGSSGTESSGVVWGGAPVPWGAVRGHEEEGGSGKSHHQR